MTDPNRTWRSAYDLVSVVLVVLAVLGAPAAVFGQVAPRPMTTAQTTATATTAAGKADYLAGLDALETGQAAEAITAFTRAIQADSENPDFYLARGVANVLAEKLAPAEKDLQRALRLRPDHRQSKLWLAVAVSMTGDFARGSTIYPFATNDLDESFVRQASHDYGEVAFRAERNEVTDELLATREQAKRNLAQGAARFAATAQSQPGLEQALAARASQAYEAGDFAAASQQLERVLAASPDDFAAMFDHARCALQLKDFSTARTECTRVLTADTAHAQAYLVRALAAAQMGDAKRAAADLETFKRIAGKQAGEDPSGWRAAAEREIASLAAAAGPPTFADLEKLAQAKLPAERIAAAALRLVKQANHGRRRYDETYQDRLRQLEDALRAKPMDPVRMVTLGQFLLDEASVRRERVEPRGPYRKFRYQTAKMESREVARAEELADQALALNGKLVDALCLKAAARFWNEQFGDAETLVRQAVALDPKSPRVLELFARVLEVASIQKSAEAAALRRPEYLGSHDEHVGDYIYTYTRWRYPSQAELQQAQQLEQQSRELVNLALAQIAAAARLSQGKPEGFQLQGLYHWRKGELEAAAAQYEQAVKLAPQQVQWHYNLAAIYEALGEAEKSFQARLVAVNLIDTTAGPLLAGTWDLVHKTKFRSAREALIRSGNIDITDSRVPAYLGVVAAAEENPAAAEGWLQLALGLEQARLQLAGKTLNEADTTPLKPEDYGLYLGVVRRLARCYLELEQPEAARDLTLACLPLAKRVSRRDLTLDVPSALLPDPALEPHVVPEADNVLALFAWVQIAAGQSLLALKDYDAAIGILSPIHTFEQLMQNGVGVTRLRAPVVYSSLYLARAYLAKGDFANAQRFAQQLPRKRHGVGPSLGPFPELEEEGARLQEEIAARQQGQSSAGSETSVESGAPDENTINQALKKIGAEIGHPELAVGTRRYTGGPVEAQLCSSVTYAVTFIVAPKSEQWRAQVLAGIAGVQRMRDETGERAELLSSRPGRSRPTDPRSRRPAANGRAANGTLPNGLAPAGPDAANDRSLARFDKAIQLLKDLAVSRGYPQEELERDLKRDPRELLRMGR